MNYINGVILGSVEIHLLTIVLKHAKQVTIDLEADKNTHMLPQPTEVKLLEALGRLEKEFGITVENLRTSASLPPLREEL